MTFRMMLRTALLLSAVYGFIQLAEAANNAGPQSLSAQRKLFHTKLLCQQRANEKLESPPSSMFKTVKYASPIGNLSAYLTPPPADIGKKRLPAIIWITGGDCNTIGDVWSPQPAKNDQTAAAFRKAGVVMMFPSLRGGNQNPGHKEGFMGEVDDVLAAADYLGKLPYVDPQRIYLGGHSTGGTLAILSAECSPQFRAVFSFGAAPDIRMYGTGLKELFPGINAKDEKEILLRSPQFWLGSITTPVYIFEGEGNSKQCAALRAMCAKSHNKNLHFKSVPGADHFSVLAPTCEMLAEKVIRDTGPTSNISF